MIDTYFTTLDSVLNDSNTNFDQSLFEKTLVNLYRLKDDITYNDKMRNLRHKHTSISSLATMQGRGFVKPYGYAGDFEIIDKIYLNHISEDPQFQLWDIYFQDQKAPRAVRNRKRYFLSKLASFETNNPNARTLNLASGPCRDIFEHFVAFPESQQTFECVDLDKDAISFAKELLKNSIDRVSFLNKNIFRFTPDDDYDLIWSAGLFDYFDDAIFVRILKRLLTHNPQGKIIIGNFSNENPTIPYMELIGEWYLNYRSPDQLIALAVAAGAQVDQVHIEREPEGVNLFLNINC